MRLLAAFVLLTALGAQNRPVTWSPQEAPIAEGISGLRRLPDDQRGGVTRQLAVRIRELPSVPNKLKLALALTSRATEGDFGRETLQAVADTLAGVLHERPVDDVASYAPLAELSRYEHIGITVDSPRFADAMKQLQADDDARQGADFTLQDLQGKSWTLRELRGKVVLLNFWATWCPPCRKEMPDLESLYEQFRGQGLVILAISDEDAAKVTPFISERRFTFPVLLDPGRKVHELFRVEGIPKNFVFDRDGKLAAQSIDMRTRRQFLELLSRAGLR